MIKVLSYVFLTEGHQHLTWITLRSSDDSVHQFVAVKSVVRLVCYTVPFNSLVRIHVILATLL